MSYARGGLSPDLDLDHALPHHVSCDVTLPPTATKYPQQLSAYSTRQSYLWMAEETAANESAAQTKSGRPRPNSNWGGSCKNAGQPRNSAAPGSSRSAPVISIELTQNPILNSKLLPS